MTEVQREFYGSQVMGAHTHAKPVIHVAQAKMIRRQSLVDNPMILDIGSGAGVGAEVIQEAIGSGSTVSMDVSTDSLLRILSTGGIAIMADAEGAQLPFCDDSFDLVILDEVIEHLVDTDSIISEIHRVLKPQGFLLISTPNLAAWFNRAALLFGIQPAFSEVSRLGVFGRPGSGLVGHLRLFTKRALLQFLRAHHFESIQTKGVVFPELPALLRPLDRIFALRTSTAGGLVVLARPLKAL